MFIISIFFAALLLLVNARPYTSKESLSVSSRFGETASGASKVQRPNCRAKKHPGDETADMLSTTTSDVIATSVLAPTTGPLHPESLLFPAQWRLPAAQEITRILRATYHFTCPIQRRGTGTFTFGATYKAHEGLWMRGFVFIDNVTDDYLDHQTGAYGYKWTYRWCDAVQHFVCWYTATGHVTGVLNQAGLSIELIVEDSHAGLSPQVLEQCTPLGAPPGTGESATCIVQRVDVSISVP